MGCSPMMKLVGHGKVEGYSLHWNPRYKGLLLSGSYDSLICQWDINCAKKIVQPCSKFRCHTGYVEDVAWFSSNGHLFGSVGDDGLFVVWDIRRGKGIQKQIVHNGEANCLCF